MNDDIVKIPPHRHPGINQCIQHQRHKDEGVEKQDEHDGHVDDPQPQDIEGQAGNGQKAEGQHQGNAGGRSREQRRSSRALPVPKHPAVRVKDQGAQQKHQHEAEGENVQADQHKGQIRPRIFHDGVDGEVNGSAQKNRIAEAPPLLSHRHQKGQGKNQHQYAVHKP